MSFSQFYEDLRRAAEEMEAEVRAVRECVKAGEDYTIGLLCEKLPAFAEKFPDLEQRRLRALETPEPVVPAPSSADLDTKVNSSFVMTTAPSSLDSLLAGAINRNADGSLPTEPSPDAVLPSSSGPAAGLASSTAAPGAALEGTSEAAQPASGAAGALPPGYKPMDQSPPRDGTPVMLFYEDVGGKVEQPAKWSFALGRQFWVDEWDDTLGGDDGFLGWRLMTSQEREEYGL